jgi:hypothetical protein
MPRDIEPFRVVPLDGYGYPEYVAEFTGFNTDEWAYVMAGNLPTDWVLLGSVDFAERRADCVIARARHAPTGKYVDFSYDHPLPTGIRDLLATELAGMFVEPGVN